MKICLVANPRAPFNQRWAGHFVNGGHEVHVISYNAGDISGATMHLLGEYPSIWEREMTRVAWAFRGVGLRSASTTSGLLSPVRGIAGQVKRSVRAGLYGLSCRNIISSIRPDIVHGFGMINHAVYAGSAGFNPSLAHALGSDVLVDSRDHAGYWHLARYAADRAQVITSEGQTMTDALVNVLGVPKGKIRTFTWGVDIQTFKPGYVQETAQLRKDLSISKESPIVVCPRGFDPIYNPDVIINAIPRVLNQYPNAVFVFLRAMASPMSEATLKRLVVNLQLVPNVRFRREFLSPHEMAVLFNLADVVVSVSKSDSGANALKEATACGAITIVSDIPANRDIVRNGKHGFILPETTPLALAEMLSSCLADLPALKQHFKEINPPYIAREHNWQGATRTMDDIYVELVSTNRETHRL